LGDRRDIDDDQAIDFAGVQQCCEHCDLPAHAVAQQRGALDAAPAE